MYFQPGDAFAFKVNSHRQMWNGQICTNPVGFRCGAEEHFRRDYCTNGDARCFHLNIFSQGEVRRYVTPDRTVVGFIAKEPSILDDQILFFYGPKFDDQVGRREAYEDQCLYGVYRVKRATLVQMGSQHSLVVEPYPDGWAVFPRNRVRKPSTLKAFEGVSYLTRVNSRAAAEAIEDAVEFAQLDAKVDPHFPVILQKQLKLFAGSFDKWIEQAKQRMKDQPFFQNAAADVSPREHQSSLGLNLQAALDRNPGVRIRRATIPIVPAGGSTESSSEAVATPKEVPWMRGTLPEPSRADVIAATYGPRTVAAINTASLAKDLIIFSGPPGVGKSWLVSRLIDDSVRERTEIVPVASTWRGREDLLGYVNPVNGEFEPTRFTRFLRRAEQAWKTGDRRMRLVIFEEFNLSQPEHWLSDMLVRLEYDPSHIPDRTLHLGGTKIAGEADGMAPEIYLPPTLMLVATLNNDHSVRPLTPRVLDRAALIELNATGRAALERVGLTAESAVADIVEELNTLLEMQDIAFSVRSAQSLARGISVLGKDQTMTVLDHILVQEVLSKVKLMAGEPRDGKLLTSLQDWMNRPECADLSICREKIAAWNEALQEGRDVFQA